MPAAELTGRISQLPPDSQTARAELGPQLHDYARGLSYLNVNVARLVDLIETWLNHEYAAWTSDPEEVAAARRRQKSRGITPPPFPLVQPVAARPDEIHERLAAEHAELQERFGVAAPKPVSELVSSNEFDQLMGLVS